MPLSIDQWKEEIGSVVSLIALLQISFYVHMMPKVVLKISFLYFLFFANSTLFHTFRKCSLIYVSFCAKLRLRMSQHEISWLFYTFIFINYLIWCSSLILLSGDIKNQSRSHFSPEQWFSVCHWNLNSIPAHNYAKLSLLSAYNLVHSFDIICLSETYLNSETPLNDARLELVGHDHLPFCSVLITFPRIKEECL